MGIAYNPRIVTDGLVFCLDAGNTKSYPGSGTAWTDLSGNSNTGTLTNGPTYSSVNGGSIVFDGVDDRVDSSTAIGTLSQYTISYWAKRDAEDRMPVSTINADFYWYGDNSWRYVHGGVGGEIYYSKNVSIPLGSWGHLCVVYNGSNVSIYRQGIYQDQQSTTGTADWSQGIRIGNAYASSGYFWLGKIATVQFYNRALSASEITQNYNAQKNRFGL